MLLSEFAPLLLLGAMILDGWIGDPPWLWRRAAHPVTWMGRLIDAFDNALNDDALPEYQRRKNGIAAILLAIFITAITGWTLHAVLAVHPIALAVEVIIVAMLLAQRSLYAHVDAVRSAFAQHGLAAARQSVAMIVGRNPESLDEAAVCRAAIESTAENFCDGVVAPAFWYLVGGLPALFAYKMINTADSMIAHRTPRHEAFGWAPARIDDVVNLIPARIAALLLAVAAPMVRGSMSQALSAVLQDAHKHRSPNAGRPEAAMAGALGLALAGPRIYGDQRIDDAWMNAGGRRAATPDDIARALTVMVTACGLLAGIAALIALVQLLA